MSKPTIEQAFPTHAYCSIIPISADSFTNRRLPWWGNQTGSSKLTGVMHPGDRCL
jgi:hypothetical protein